MQKPKAAFIAAAVLAVIALLWFYNLHLQSMKRPSAKTITNKIIEMKREGYATELAEYYLLRAKYYFDLGKRDKAYESLEEAWKALLNSERAPSVANTRWPLIRDALNIDREPGSWDFVPLGRVFVKTSGGWLTYPRNDRRWVLSCFIILAYGKTPKGKVVVYQGRLPFTASEYPFTPRIYFNTKWHVLRQIVFAGPLYYNEDSEYGGPMVYEYDLTGKIMEYIVYVPSKHLWRHEILARNGTSILKLEIREEEVMWIADWTQGLVIHGVYSKVEGFDAWGGFWTMGRANITLRINGREVKATGYAVFDRASHRSYPRVFTGHRGAPLSFTCMVAWSPYFSMAVSQSVNPSPLKPPTLMEHQARIWVNGREYRLKNFILEVNGGLPPSNLTLRADEGSVKVYLNGKVFLYWPPAKWPEGRGTWWNKNITYVWGRVFVHWKGYVILGDKRVPVDAIGAAEMTRIIPERVSQETGRGDLKGCGCAP